MTDKYSSNLEMLKSNDSILLSFLKAKFPMFHNSNFFFRDLQYGIRSFLKNKEIKSSYQEAENFASDIAKYFEEKGIFTKINSQGWRVNYPEFATKEPGDPL